MKIWHAANAKCKLKLSWGFPSPAPSVGTFGLTQCPVPGLRGLSQARLPVQRWSRSKAVTKSATNNVTLNARGDTHKTFEVPAKKGEPEASALLICHHQILFPRLQALSSPRSVRARRNLKQFRVLLAIERSVTSRARDRPMSQKTLNDSDIDSPVD